MIQLQWISSYLTTSHSTGGSLEKYCKFKVIKKPSL